MGEGGKGRILVVDDDDATQRLVKRAAEAAGYQVIQAMNGALGLELAASEQFDLILLDINMPHLDGRDVLTRLKKASTSAEVPVLVLSGSRDFYDRRIVLELGAEDFLEKPVSAQSLILKIGSLIRRARGRVVGRSKRLARTTLID